MTNFLKTNKFLISVVLVVAASVFSLARRSPAKAQTEKPPAAPVAVVDQHCKVVPDVLPLNLENELKKLNAQGVAVEPTTDIRIVDDKFTIIVCDAANGDEDSGR